MGALTGGAWHPDSPRIGVPGKGATTGRAVSDDVGGWTIERELARSPKYRQRGQPRGARFEKVAPK